MTKKEKDKLLGKKLEAELAALMRDFKPSVGDPLSIYIAKETGRLSKKSVTQDQKNSIMSQIIYYLKNPDVNI